MPRPRPRPTTTVRTKAIELRVEGVERLPRVGTRDARPGYEFVVVDTSWKNIIPLTPIDKNASASSPTAGLSGFGTAKRPPPDPANIVMKPTAYVVPMLADQVWLMTDGRFADTVDLDAQTAVPGHLSPQGFSIPEFEQVLRGKLVFEAPKGAAFQALQFFDTNHGHARIPLVGTAPGPAPSAGPARQNELVDVSLTEARAVGDAVNGRRRWIVGLRGTSRSPKDIVKIPLQFVFAQSDRGCLASPERDAAGLTRPFVDRASFPPAGANEGQLAFSAPRRDPIGAAARPRRERRTDRPVGRAGRSAGVAGAGPNHRGWLDRARAAAADPGAARGIAGARRAAAHTNWSTSSSRT